MSAQITPSHVAILVHSVQKAADHLRRFDFQIGEAAEWEGEGTREIYVERDKANSLLLMEPIKPGAYQRALEKRGPGLHHLAIDVTNLESFLVSLSGSGWLLHPMSVQTMKATRTAYLARPGFPALIEVQEREAPLSQPLFVESISLEMDASLAGLLESIGLRAIIKPSSLPTELRLAGHPVSLRALLG